MTDSSVVEVFYDDSIVEVLPVTDVDVVEVLNPGPQGPSGPPGGLILPFSTPFMRIKVTGELQVFNSDQDTYHTLLVQGNAGEEYLTIGTGET